MKLKALPLLLWYGHKMPQLNSAIDPKTKMVKTFIETTSYTETRIILKGSPMGLLLTITYPNETTFVGPRI